MNTWIAQLQEFLDRAVAGKPPLERLDAGCGHVQTVRFEHPVRVTGIDISESQLLRNRHVDAKVVGDVQYQPFLPRSFDIIVCWDVLEHLPHPELALERFAEEIRSGGLIVLKSPNPSSLKGFLTKCLPHSFHVFAYKHLYKTGELDPFKTYLRRSITPRAIKKFAAARGLHVAYFRTWDIRQYPRFLRQGQLALLARGAYVTADVLARFLSFGRLGDSEFVMVLQSRDSALPPS